MKAKGMFIRDSVKDTPGIGTWWGGKGMFVDFTNKDTRENWKAMLKENVLECGTSSVWNDNCEYDSLVDKDCRCSFEGKGGTIGQLKSVMSNIMCHITERRSMRPIPIPVLTSYAAPGTAASSAMLRPGPAII
mgnify:CR=1 FL=1